MYFVLSHLLSKSGINCGKSITLANQHLKKAVHRNYIQPTLIRSSFIYRKGRSDAEVVIFVAAVISLIFRCGIKT